MSVKMNPLPLIAAASCALALNGAALAVQDEDLGFDTTEDLYQVCSTPSDAPEYVATSFACRGFIEATVQYHDAISDRKHMKRLVCYDSKATIADGRAAFVAWAEANKGNATLMDEPPVVGVIRALAAKYPCK
jgi:hypothetical protein